MIAGTVVVVAVVVVGVVRYSRTYRIYGSHRRT